MQSQTARQRGLTSFMGLAALAGSLLCAVPATAQDNTADEYALLLQQIADVETNITQRQFYITQQEQNIAKLRADIADAGDTDAQAQLLPVLRDMVAQLEAVMVNDLPIRVERRFALLDDLREDIRAEDAAVYDGFRRAFDLIAKETEMGLSVASYTGNNPVNPGQRFAACQQDPKSAKCDLSKDQNAALEAGAYVDDFNQLGQLPDGNYIHYGRMALLYLERDSSEGYRYDAGEKQWVSLPNSELLSLRQDVRIARGESAISTMSAPIAVSGETGDDAS